MENNQCEIIDPETNLTKQAEILSMPNYCAHGCASRNFVLFQKIINDLRNSTMHLMQKKRVDFITNDLDETRCKPQEDIFMRTPSIEDNVIKREMKAVDRIKRKTVDAITSTTRLGEAFNKIKCKNLSGAVKDFVHDVCIRYAKDAARYVGNAVSEHSCASQCISAETQSDTTDGEFSSETSLDAFTKACKRKLRADFILEKIAKVSDALSRKARFDLKAEKERISLIGTDVSVTSTTDGTEKEIFESTKPLVSPIIRAKKKSKDIKATDVAADVMRRKTDRERMRADIPTSPSIHFAKELQDSSAYLDATYESVVKDQIPSTDKTRKKLRPMLDKSVSVVSDTIDAAVDTSVIDRQISLYKRRSKKIQVARVTDKIMASTYLGAASSETTRKGRDRFKESRTKVHSDDRAKWTRSPQPVRYYNGLISDKTCFKRYKYCDTWSTSRFRLQSEAAQNAALNYACFPFLQNLCATRYHSSIDNSAFSRKCNINNCAKRRATFGNSLYTNMYCNGGTKYCYSRLNDIDNVRMGYYHCNDSYPAWNDGRHCGRSRSYYCTGENLYFMHPWTSRHLLRYN
ncbi:uncharacterized protein [Linepithema humile]|uniref:uncharacterized protein isoform X1 n=1 Tax=Linepithema humile TaxID=83485 RepID=UPI00351E3657